MRRLLAAVSLVLAAVIAQPAFGQSSADIIRGKIIGPDSLPVANAAVLATSIAGGIEKQARTNKDGRFSITFANGEGDYWITVAAIGFTQKKFQLKRLADEEILIADTRLAPATLAPVEITAQGSRQTATRADNTADVSGTDRFLGLTTGAAADAGNLAALAASLPGFQLIPGLDGNPDVFSMLGLSPDQNSSTLNGAPGGADLPRDAAVGASVGSSPWDVSRGGFSGAQVNITTRPGDNYARRRASGQANPRALQWTDQVGQQAGAESNRFSISGQFSGPITLNRNFFNGSYQFDRTTSDSRNLFNTDPAAFLAAGVSPDSVTRFREILQARGVPSTVPSLPDGRVQNALRLQGVIDLAPRSATSGHAYQVAGQFNVSHVGAAATSSNNLLNTPGMNTESSSLTAGIVGRHTNFFWDKVITESWLSASWNSNTTDPYLRFPGGTVRVTSALDDGTSSVRNVQFGGNTQGSRDASNGTIGFRNQMRWFSTNNRHAYKLTTELGQAWYSNESDGNEFGRFSFLSLSDFEAGIPSSYSRQIAPSVQQGSQLTGALSLGDAWRPRTNVQVQYGVRVDGNKFTSTPQANPAVREAFGVSNNYVPDRLYFSTRGGVSWTYGTAPQVPYQLGFIQGPRATVRAGVGIYQNVGGPTLIGQALTNTGLPGAARQLVCSGPATPMPDWDAYRTNPMGAPLECADGSSPFASSLPGVTLFDRTYVQPRSVRSTVNWSGVILDARFRLGLEGVYSMNLNQASSIDLNFNPTQRFALGDEGGRPVYVQASNIHPVTGAIASRADRVSQEFATVNSLRSDLRSTSRQLNVQLNPYTVNATAFSWGLNYTLLSVREQYRGYGGGFFGGAASTAGDPRERHWGAAQNAPHQFRVNLNYNFWDYVRVSWSPGLSSGTRFTPLVAGDINGDGSGFNDRAFIHDPSSTNDPALAAAMSSIMTSGSSAARECLGAQLGQIAARNSCTTPWTFNPGQLSFSIQPYKLKLPTRATFNFQINNPFAAADLLLHGADKARGWGQTRNPDGTLLYVRGFDPVTQSYKYEVNQRFGGTSSQQTAQRTPVSITAWVTYDLAPTMDWQQLKMQLNRGRSQPGTKLGEAQLKSYVTNTVPNVMARILQSAELVGLTRKQADSLAVLSFGFTRALDSIWTPVAKHLGGLDSTYRASDSHQRFVLAREAATNYLIKVAPDVKGLLTASQRRRLSAGLVNLLEPRYLERVRAGMVGGGGLGMEMMMVMR